VNLAPVLRALDAQGIGYALIGGHALAIRGFPRFTVDIDLLTTNLRALDPATWVDLERSGAAVDRRRGDDDDPLAGVVHVRLPDETEVDIIVGRWAWEAGVIARAEPIVLAEGLTVAIPSAADLILLKLAAGGPLDLRDAAALLRLADRPAIIRDVEAHIGDVRPDVREVWKRVVEEDKNG
jgi:hypothetical protein